MNARNQRRHNKSFQRTRSSGSAEFQRQTTRISARPTNMTTMQHESDNLINQFLNSAVEAINLLYTNNHFGQMLVVMYSTIDTMGLLDAPPTQNSATGDSFKEWVKKYILPHGNFDFNEVDFWAARCSILHTHTSESDLSRAGKARQIQYYTGSSVSEMAKAFAAKTKKIDNGEHVSANIPDTVMAFLKGIQKFTSNLSTNCKIKPAYATRLRKILQPFPIPTDLWSERSIAVIRNLD